MTLGDLKSFPRLANTLRYMRQTKLDRRVGSWLNAILKKVRIQKCRFYSGTNCMVIAHIKLPLRYKGIQHLWANKRDLETGNHNYMRVFSIHYSQKAEPSTIKKKVSSLVKRGVVCIKMILVTGVEQDSIPAVGTETLLHPVHFNINFP